MSVSVCRSFIAEMQLFVRQLGRRKKLFVVDPSVCHLLCQRSQLLSLLQESQLESTAQTRSWQLSHVLCPWFDSCTTWGSSRRTLASQRKRMEKPYVHVGCGKLIQAPVDDKCVFCVQLEAYEVNVSPDLQQQLLSVIQELGIHILPPVSYQGLPHSHQMRL